MHLPNNTGRRSTGPRPAVSATTRLGRIAAAKPLALIVGIAAILAAVLTRADTVTLTALQTTDMHGYIDVVDLGDENGGMLRLATLIRRLRAQHGDALLVLDCGDTLSGSFSASLTRGALPLAAFNAMGVDLWVPGNHELDFGTARCLELIQQARPKALCGNLALTVNGTETRVPGWTLVTRGGARIAVIGITARYLTNWLWGDNMATFTVEDAADAVARDMPAVLAAKPDAIVLAAHQGWVLDDRRGVNEIVAITERFPEIDLIFGGHTHRQIAGMRVGHGTWYVQGGRHARHAALCTLLVDTEEHRLVDVSSRLVEITEDLPPDPDVAAACREQIEGRNRRAARVIGRTREPVSSRGRPGVNCQTSELIAAALARASGATVVLHGTLSRRGLPKGDVTETDLHGIVPYENGIATVELTPAELREILEEQWENRSSYAYCGLYGCRATVSRSGRASLVDAPATGRISVALNSYTVAGAGGRFPRLRAIVRRPECRLRDTGKDSRSAVRDYLAENSPLTISPTEWLQQTD